MLARSKLRRGTSDVALDDHHVVFVDERALVHVQREAAARATQCVQHAGSAVSDFRVDGHHVVRMAKSRRRELRHTRGCLLYTSDAADEEDSVDLGGRRIIKKKKKKK